VFSFNGIIPDLLYPFKDAVEFRESEVGDADGVYPAHGSFSVSSLYVLEKMENKIYILSGGTTSLSKFH